MATVYASTIGNPEFINVTPCNPLISECEIKVMYLGDNRNHTSISKEVAIKMANSLPGCPIVGHYKKDIEDFGEHDRTIEIDDSGVHFKVLTTPYGFVAPDAKIWFQKFQEVDEDGTIAEREYLMTTGFLWTGQFPECQKMVEGKGSRQSMELDKQTLQGDWTKKDNSSVEFFIVNDGLFSKLCALGNTVEPCFEGSTITAPNVSKNFSKEDTFNVTLFSMMQELKQLLNKEGEQQIMEKDFSENQDKIDKDDLTKNENKVEQEVVTDFVKKEEDEKETSKESEKEDVKENPADDKKEEEDKDDDKKKANFSKESKKDDDEEKEADNKDEKEPADEEDKDNDKEEKNKYSLLETEYNQLQAQYTALLSQFNSLQEEVSGLRKFKLNEEEKQKNSLINSFYMLSEEDKQDVIKNKATYSLDEIESKLSVICVRKRVNFDEEDKKTDIEDSAITYSLNDPSSSVPAWVTAVRNTQKSRNN